MTPRHRPAPATSVVDVFATQALTYEALVHQDPFRCVLKRFLLKERLLLVKVRCSWFVFALSQLHFV